MKKNIFLILSILCALIALSFYVPSIINNVPNYIGYIGFPFTLLQFVFSSMHKKRIKKFNEENANL
jgi:Flp pilus assembly protein TadB